MWRDRLRQNPSNAEVTVRIELQKRHLLHLLKPEGTVILFRKKGIKILSKEQVTKKIVEAAQGFTVPDFLACTRNGVYPWYLDGPPHERNGVKNRDERINRTLRFYGVEPERISYTPPLPDYKLHQICDHIQKVLENNVT